MARPKIKRDSAYCEQRDFVDYDDHSMNHCMIKDGKTMSSKGFTLKLDDPESKFVAFKL